MPSERATSSLSLMERSWKPSRDLRKAVHAKQPRDEETENDVVVINVLFKDQPHEIRRGVFRRRNPQTAGSADELPDLEEVFQHQRCGDGRNGKVVALQLEEGIADDKRPAYSQGGSDRHGQPEGNVPAGQHHHGGIGPDPYILGLSQIHLTAVAADSVPAHAVERKHEKLDHGGHGERGMRKKGKNQEQCEHHQGDRAIEAWAVGKIKSAFYCFHPNNPRGRTTMMTK